MKLSILFTVLIFFSNAFSQERKLYVGVNSTEAVLTFQGSVLISSSRKPTDKKVSAQIDAQVVHMFGPMGNAQVKAVPRGNHNVTNINLEKSEAGIWKATYTYTGTAVLENSDSNIYNVILPLNPTTIYEASRVGRSYPCTDSHYSSEGDFWYFWSPFRYGCKLQENVDYIVIPAQVQRIENSKQTYPEYARLIGADGKIKMTLLMGMDDPNRAKDPNMSPDINAGNFREIKAQLLSEGWQSRLYTRDEVAAIVQERVRMPYVEQFTKVISNGSQQTEMVLDIFFGPSGIDEDSTAFHYFLKNALENSAIMMYAGHSGLGGHLDLESIESAHGFKIDFKSDKYQILFFNSCTSYSYYNTMYFSRKANRVDPNGTKNLDIFTNGLSTYFSVMPQTNLAVVHAVELWASGRASTSYQTLAQTIDSDNLFGINGDEDNPQR